VSASLLVVQARVWSGRLLDADAVLTRDDRIVAVGRAADLAAAAPDATVLDADGATVTPGLTDAHIHFVPFAQSLDQPDLDGAATRAEALQRVADALAASAGTATPLVGRGWDENGWEATPDRAALDALAPARAVILHRHDFHALWVNSVALAAAGVTRSTPDPAGGRFERDAAGEPTGFVREHAVRAFAGLESVATPAASRERLERAAHALHREGITTVHDFQRDHADWQVMRGLAARRRLRVLQQVGVESLRERQSLGLRAGEGNLWFRTGSLKLFADGTLGSRTAAMLEPYDDAETRGMELLTRDELVALAGEAAAAGFSVAIHAIGDAAVRNALDGIDAHAAALAQLPIAPRIEHVQLLHAADVPRFAGLGIVASMQPQHAVTDAPVARLAWRQRTGLAYPWRTLLAAGTRIAFGSDAPVEPPLARLGLAAALTRLDKSGTPFEPAQAIPLDAALVAYTSGPATLAGGLLGPGTLERDAPADLVVWDRDLHSTPPESLAGVRPRWTALAGEIVYDSRRDSRAGPGNEAAARASGGMAR